MITRKLYLGCTVARHRERGVHVVINARAGRPELNREELEEVEMMRDARSIREASTSRVRWYGPTSKFFRRRRARIAHLIASRED